MPSSPGGGGGSAAPAPTTPGEVPLPAPGASLPYTPAEPSTEALAARAWLLTPEEYGRAVSAVIGVTIDVSDLDPIPDTGVYPNMSASGVVRVNLAQQYTQKAEAAVTGLADAALGALAACPALDATCKDAFIDSVVSKAFRRPATADDRLRYGELFDLGAASGERSFGFRAVLRGVLTSPYFLYRTEIGAPADEASPRFRLTGHEVASLLSFSVLGQPPSAALLAAAERGALDDPAGLATELGTLLASPEASAKMGEFLVQWLRLHHFEDQVEKFEDVFPGFASIKGAMFAEARAFVTREGGLDGTIQGLLTAELPAPSPELAAFYASDGSASSTQTRVGLLSLGALLSKTAKQYLTSPTLRGLFVRDQLLCQHITLPENFTPPPIEATEAISAPKTTRELYELHAKEPVCKSCHSLIDPIGYLLESFDGAGRLRTRETYQSPSFTAPSAGPQPIDATGELIGTDVDGNFGSYVELAQALADSAWVKECVARQAYRYYFGAVEPARGVAPVLAGTEALRQSGVLGDLVESLLATPAAFERTR